MANTSVVYSELEKKRIFLVTIDTTNTYITIDQDNTSGVSQYSCVLEGLTYYINQAHTITFSNGEASPKEFAMAFEAGAGVDTSREIFIPSAIGKPLRMKCSVAGTFLVTLSYRR